MKSASHLKLAEDSDEAAFCSLHGIRDEVELLKECICCALVKADVLKRISHSE